MIVTAKYKFLEQKRYLKKNQNIKFQD